MYCSSKTRSLEYNIKTLNYEEQLSALLRLKTLLAPKRQLQRVKMVSFKKINRSFSFIQIKHFTMISQKWRHFLSFTFYLTKAKLDPSREYRRILNGWIWKNEMLLLMKMMTVSENFALLFLKLKYFTTIEIKWRHFPWRFISLIRFCFLVLIIKSQKLNELLQLHHNDRFFFLFSFLRLSLR